MNRRNLAFDAKSVRSIDRNGYLHVDVSNITKEQVAPYEGAEIPGAIGLSLQPDKIYSVYRPASELSKPETVASLNGIPVLLRHTEDSAENPAPNRVGSTGTDAKWEAPYLTNSLHIQDADAIRRIEDGSMRELSLGYTYTPVRQSGTFNGEHYDIIMTEIRCNHVALVPEGRAGHDVLVQDAALHKGLPAGDGQEDKSTSSDTQENTMNDEKEKAVAELVELAEGAGLDPEAFKAKLEAIIEMKPEAPKDIEDEDLEQQPEDETEDEDIEQPEDETEDEDLEQPEDETEDEDPEPEEDLTTDAEEVLKSCGLDAADPVVKTAFQKGFREGTRYGEKVEKQEPKKLDAEHESRGEKLVGDSAERISRLVRRQLEAKYDAVDECRKSLGRVRVSAFDSAADVYRAALKQEGVSIKGLTRSECRTAYRALMAGRAGNQRVTMDSKPAKVDALSKMLNNIRRGE